MVPREIAGKKAVNRLGHRPPFGHGPNDLFDRFDRTASSEHIRDIGLVRLSVDLESRCCPGDPILGRVPRSLFTQSEEDGVEPAL